MKTSTKVLIGVGVVALIGGVVFYLYKKNKPKIQIKKGEKEVIEAKTTSNEPLLKTEIPKTLSQEEANKIAKLIKSTAELEKTQKLVSGYVSPNLARFESLKEAGFSYSNGTATKK